MSMVSTMTTRIDKSTKLLGAVFLAVGIVVGLLGMATPTGDPHALEHAYLFGWVYWACLVFGCFGLSLLHHCTRGHWGFPILRLFEAGGGPVNLGLFGLLFLPIVFWKQVFYPWARPAEVAVDPILQHKAVWFNLWEPRLLFYFVVMIALAVLNKNWQKKEDESGDEKWWKKRQYFGGLFIVIFMFCSNFLWTDVLMSQYSHWFSTIYGVWFVVGSCLLAFAFCSVIIGTQAKKKPYDEVVKPWLLKDLGNWMLTFTMLWAYFSLSQYLIIWSGNLEEFTSFFIQRSVNGWDVHGTALIGLHFLIPFVALLAPRTKKVPMMLAGIGLYILFARFLDLWYVVTPTWKTHWGINLLDIGMFLAFGGVWLLLFGFQVAQAPLITHRIHPFKEAVDHV